MRSILKGANIQGRHRKVPKNFPDETRLTSINLNFKTNYPLGTWVHTGYPALKFDEQVLKIFRIFQWDFLLNTRMKINLEKWRNDKTCFMAKFQTIEKLWQIRWLRWPPSNSLTGLSKTLVFIKKLAKLQGRLPKPSFFKNISISY